MVEKGLDFDIVIGVLTIVGVLIFARWRGNPVKQLQYSAVAVAFVLFSVGLYYMVTGDWQFGVSTWIMAVVLGVFALMLIWLVRKRSARS